MPPALTRTALSPTHPACRWNAALQTGDPEKVADMYAEDAILLPTVSNKVGGWWAGAGRVLGGCGPASFLAAPAAMQSCARALACILPGRAT